MQQVAKPRAGHATSVAEPVYRSGSTLYKTGEFLNYITGIFASSHVDIRLFKKQTLIL